ncbi:unnamed protein product [Chilo suppressalis]|uniref:Uncharacterized protein n=1 Tax=Chilo suppressalis TaxID=168631 RepID=A0ABN8L1D0_CHISP|nr:unnamed protein product [Chilo suppressalis]
MADKAVHFNTGYNLYDIETIAKWLSCNGEAWGMGPTVVFASAAALFLYNELEATVFVPGDQLHVSVLEKTLISTMVLGMLALMVHLWVCSMRFFQYYLDTLIKDSPNMLLEMTTAGLLGAEVMPLSTLTRFLRQQQPQIHITICWFLSLCYADYVRKHYCQRFNMPYLEQWQSELHARAARGVHQTMEKVNSFVGCVHRRLRGYGPPGHRTTDTHTDSAVPKRPSSVAVSGAASVLGQLSDRDVGGSSGYSGSGSATPAKELCVRLVSQSSETTVDAIEKLRALITATRCTCSGSQDSCVAGAVCRDAQEAAQPR